MASSAAQTPPPPGSLPHQPGPTPTRYTSGISGFRLLALWSHPQALLLIRVRCWPPWVPVEGHNVVLNIVAEGPRPGSARGRGPGLGAPRPHAGPSVALGGDLRGRPPAPPLARRCPAPWRAWRGACQQRLLRPAVPRVPGTGASSPAAGWGTRLRGRPAQHGARSPLSGPEAPRAETARPPLPAPRVPSVRLTDAAVNLAPPPSAAANGARV